MKGSSAAAEAVPRERIAGRYEVQRVLGRGGMAVVYRATDTATGGELAIKQLRLRRDSSKYADAAVLFEREFHTLKQLAHPRIVEVYDYGVDESGPYYTMELLDSGDLQQRAPLPWKRACELLFDVCSSLALLHSRGLVHRDVSPRNVRFCTGGRAKLIDFGAMTAFGPCRTVVGTAPFVAPEVVHRSTLDARTDLFSVGATLYLALTGQFAFPARKFAELAALWSAPCKPPSSIVADIPPALDALVLSLIAVDPAARPRSAAEVMQRLSAIASIERAESADVSLAYLSAPLLVGRERALLRFRKRLIRSLRGRGCAVLIAGPAGVGRTRLLDTCALDAQIMGATVLRASAAGARRQPFAVAQMLLEQLLESLPEAAIGAARTLPVIGERVLASEPPSSTSQEIDIGAQARARIANLANTSGDLLQVQSALHEWLLCVAEDFRLVIAVDDLHLADAASAGLLAGLAQAAGDRKLLVVATVEQDAPAAAQVALDVFSQQAARIELAKLKPAQTETLLRSVFGDVPHLAPFSEAVHELCSGLPRDCMALAQHLVASSAVLYQSGTWCLPERLDAALLPRSIEEALQQRVARCSPLARRLAQCHALAGVGRLERADYLELAGPGEAAAVDRAIDELVGAQVLWSDGLGYAFTHGGWAAPLLGGLPPEQVQQRQLELARMCERRGAHALRVIDHLMAAGASEQALDRLMPLLDAEETSHQVASEDVPIERFAFLCERALDCAERLQRPAREIYILQRWLTLASAVVDDRLYWHSAPIFVHRLKQDAGLTAFEQLDPALPAQERLTRALQTAAEAYQAAPASERVYRPDEAIRLLTYYVGVSIAVGGRTLDEPLMDSLPALLEPFASLSPLVHAIWQNALATQELLCRAQPERARQRWIAALDQLKHAPGIDPRYVDIVRGAIAFALAATEARLGLATARRWVEEVEGDPMQAVSVQQVRRVLRLQQGDWEGAERARRQAELLAAQSDTRRMFYSLVVELAAQSMASDLSGVKQTWERIAVLAARYPGYVPYRFLAEGRYERIRGNLAGARAALELCLAHCTPKAEHGYRNRWPWISGSAELVTVLVGLGRPDEGRALGAGVLADCERFDIRAGAHDVVRALALAEAASGDCAAAKTRLSALLDEQRALGVLGLSLGATYEAGARIALWSGDEAGFDHYARLTAKEYRYGEGSALAAHYERLMSEARKAGMLPTAQLADFAITQTSTSMSRRAEHRAAVERALRAADGAGGRALAALRLLCDAKGVDYGHLFVCGPGGLELAASLGPHAASPEMRGAARSYLNAEVERSETTTLLVSLGTQTSEPPVLSLLPSADGPAYRPVPIISELDGEAVYAGIALLGSPVRAVDQTSVPQLIAALGQQLIDFGDVRPLRSR